MCHKILEETKQVKQMLATNPYSDESQRYIKKNELQWLQKDMKDFWLAINLMDVFIKWLELQIEVERKVGRDYVIALTGP